MQCARYEALRRELSTGHADFTCKAKTVVNKRQAIRVACARYRTFYDNPGCLQPLTSHCGTNFALPNHVKYFINLTHQPRYNTVQPEVL